MSSSPSSRSSDAGSSDSDQSTLSMTQQDLTKIKPSFPAASLINLLLQSHALDFANCQRNTLTVRELWEQSLLCYDDILNLMTAVRDSGDEVLWDEFLRYSDAIEPLEKFLLELQLNDHHQPNLPGPDNVQPSITFVKAWLETRQTLLTTARSLGNIPQLHNLSTEPRNLQDRILKSRRDDDASALQTLSQAISVHAMTDEDVLGRDSNDKFVSEVKQGVEVISTESAKLAIQEEERMGKIVFSVMALYIPFVVREHEPDNAHFSSKEVWQAAADFAKFVAEFAKSASVTIAALEAAWATFERILMKEAQAFGLQMINLMRLAAMVRRPFVGRTIAIVRMWHALSTSPKVHEENSTGRRRALTDLMQDTQAGFKTIQTTVKTFYDSPDLETAISDGKQTYDKLVDRLKEEIQTYASDKLAALEGHYANGAKVDDEHLSLFRTFANARNFKEEPDLIG